MLSEHSTEHDEYLNLTICFLGRHIFCQTRVVLNVKTPALGRVRLRSALRRVSKCLAPSERPTVFVGRGNDVLRVVCVCVCVCVCVRVCVSVSAWNVGVLYVNESSWFWCIYYHRGQLG